MGDKEWVDIRNKYRNSVIQIFANIANYNSSRPYRMPVDTTARGSGFIIDTHGHVLTNAHVVMGSMSLLARIPKMGDVDLDIKLVNICPDKDLALLQFPENIQKKIGKIIPIQIGDDKQLQETEKVITMGYPLGQEQLKFTTGIISGYHIEKNIYGKSSYLQITAAINPGNSGGPLLNKRGQLVGINSAGIPGAQNIGYSIPSRCVISCLHTLFYNKSHIFYFPIMDIRWNKTTKELIGKNKDGIYVAKVFPGSFIKGIKEGDVINYIKYNNIYDHKNAYSVIEHKRKKPFYVSNKKYNKTLYLNNYGQLTNIQSDSSVREYYPLQEILDSICINTNLVLGITRNNKKIELKTTYKPSSQRTRNVPIIPPIENFDYEIIFGMCITLNYINHLKTDLVKKIIQHYHDEEVRYKQLLMVTQVFPKSITGKIHVIKDGLIIDKIDGKNVKTLESLRKQILNAVKKKQKNIVIETDQGLKVVLNIKESIEDDKKIYETYKIDKSKFFKLIEKKI